MNDKKNNRAHVIVIGGTSGLGLALALAHQQLGWQVSVVGHNQAKIDRINAQHPDITTHHCDLTDFTQRQTLLNTLSASQFQRLIYSAGSYFNERVQQLDKATSTQMLAINLQAFEYVFMWASAQLMQQVEANTGVGSIKPSLVCIASIAGIIDYPYSSLYAKSKRAMIATASAYRCALAPYDIQVTCIASGYIDTQALRDLNGGDASHKPFIISIQTAVRYTMQALADDVGLAVFPRSMRYITRALNQLPKPMLNWLLRSKLDKSL
ncbi:SDR family NAD(P)-dependent oxidoreductase [Psychrobacter fulvigenes]|uniref:SDR family NAD(P)-dependent oxidoreductase n=1 Tax=Psychrobacter fulvigenes TaxID=533323 RepID=UPI001917CE13|nr:SDR family NAD(P)-dependent oxidoreductase [Psychrobacter fulvigenes]